MVKLIVPLCLVFLLAACNTNRGLNSSDKEYILTKVNNYQGLIQFYREQLSKEDTTEIRYKLCEVYNKVNDIPSSQSCLRELLNNSPTDKSYLLAAKNYLILEDEDSALFMVTKALEKEPNNGEAYNVRGEIFARKGRYDDARIDFEKARSLFVAEELVNNNLAMLAILEQDYSTAYSYLMPLYSRGYNSPEIVHNLIFVLIKKGDYITADSLMRQNSLDDSSDALISRLADIKPVLNSSTKQGILKEREKISKETVVKPSVIEKDNQLEKVSLLPNMQNKITNILIGDHGKFVRFVFISPQPLKGEAISSRKDNHAVLKVFDVKNDKKIESVVSDIKKFTRTVNAVSVSEVEGALVLNFDTKRQVRKLRVYNSALSKVSTNKLVFDIIYN
ncbi:tetratricopeptide repeat protein [Salmonella enterica]|nr:tetratricopeptide repeat protein [Salmonella enterica]EEP1053119.1 tetratricopeptide repeat protein [Salmonella enterica]EEP1113475.1 tetratricopeptide repeat protein [Salmonella enterica]